MISYQQALQLIRQHTNSAAIELCELPAARGRVCASDLHSKETLPAFDNSAMDGFAVCASDLCVGAQRVIVGSSFAGDQPVVSHHVAQTAWRIMTGAPIPQGYDAVIPIEKVTVNGDVIIVNDSVFAGQHIRRRGEDFTVNALVVRVGQTIQPLNIMALAATGHAKIPVFCAANAVVFATGNELVDDAEQTLSAGQIRNSNAPFLCSALRQFGVEVRYGGVQRDDADAFRQQLASVLLTKPTLIISSGAVSAGDADFIPQVIRDLGGEIIFHKVAIKPGKPILFAKFQNGTFYFGLPGNPISTAIGFRFFVHAFLYARTNRAFGKTIAIKLGQAICKRTDLREFRKALVSLENGELVVVESIGQESHRIAPLQHSNAWMVVDESISTLSAGQLITVAGWADEALVL